MGTAPCRIDRINTKPDIFTRFSPFYECLRVTYMNLGQKQPVEIEKCETKLRRSIAQDYQESSNKLAIVNANI